MRSVEVRCHWDAGGQGPGVRPGQPCSLSLCLDFIPLFTVGILQAASQARLTLCLQLLGAVLGKRGRWAVRADPCHPHTIPASGASPHPGAGDQGGCPVQCGAVFTRGVVYLKKMLGCHPGILSAHPLSWQPAGFGFPWTVSTSHSKHFGLAQTAVLGQEQAAPFQWILK